MEDRLRMIAALRRPGVFAAEAAELLETHISWVLLAGDHAYKIKKPLDLGFLDFSTLERRQHFCNEELRLNRRLAPEIYESVIPIAGDFSAPEPDGRGTPIEYAVRMRRFAQTGLLNRLARAGELDDELTDRIADSIAAFHLASEPAAPEQPHGTAETVAAPVGANFAQVRPLLTDTAALERLRRLQEWSGREHSTRLGDFSRRKAEGKVRECHGDLHLGNMVRIGERVVIFDCLEFDPALRWIDVASDIAFVCMDLEDHELPSSAQRLLNRYLEHTGDYDALTVLPYYMAYRAMVRAKVHAIRMSQAAEACEAARLASAVSSCLALAEGYTRPRVGFLLITRGPSGSGKTHWARPLAQRLGAIHLRSDVERRRLTADRPPHRGGLGAGRYAPGWNARTYQRLRELAERALSAGFPVIVDATFLARERREAMRELADGLGVAFGILSFEAPAVLLRERVQARLRAGGDASEATPEVVEQQLLEAEALGEAERARSLRIDGETTADALAERVRRELLAGGPIAPRPAG